MQSINETLISNIFSVLLFYRLDSAYPLCVILAITGEFVHILITHTFRKRKLTVNYSKLDNFSKDTLVFFGKSKRKPRLKAGQSFCDTN
jgi:hypothetical protein